MNTRNSTTTSVLSRRGLLLSGAAMAALAAFWPMTEAALGKETTKKENKMTTTMTQRDTAPQSAKEVRGASPYNAIKNEPAPRLIVDAPLPDELNQGIVHIQWRAENVHIVPVFGKGALNVSPRVGHLHIHVDDLPWWWADASNINTIDLAGMPPGSHKIRIDLVNANHAVFPEQSKTVTFTIPEGTSRSHSH
jgi:hypothetical protein